MLKRQPNSTNVVLDGLIISHAHLKLLVHWASVSRTIQTANGLLVDFDHTLNDYPLALEDLDIEATRDKIDLTLNELTTLRAPLDELSMQIKNWSHTLSEEDYTELEDLTRKG